MKTPVPTQVIHIYMYAYMTACMKMCRKADLEVDDSPGRMEIVSSEAEDDSPVHHAIFLIDWYALLQDPNLSLLPCLPLHKWQG